MHFKKSYNLCKASQAGTGKNICIGSIYQNTLWYCILCRFPCDVVLYLFIRIHHSHNLHHALSVWCVWCVRMMLHVELERHIGVTQQPTRVTGSYAKGCVAVDKDKCLR